MSCTRSQLGNGRSPWKDLQDLYWRLILHSLSTNACRGRQGPPDNSIYNTNFEPLIHVVTRSYGLFKCPRKKMSSWDLMDESNLAKGNLARIRLWRSMMFCNYAPQQKDLTDLDRFHRLDSYPHLSFTFLSLILLDCISREVFSSQVPIHLFLVATI